MRNNNIFLKCNISLTCIMVVCSLFILSCNDTKEPPNIVFIMSDDHGADAISAYGSEIIDTPNIDRIANNGIRFTNTFVTSSLCAPSRAAILTSKYGAKNGFKRNEDVFDGSQQTFPKLLQDGGYKTALFGKWHLGSRPTGFDHYEIIRGHGQFFDPKLYNPGIEWNEEWKPGGLNDQGEVAKGYLGDIITNRAIEWLEKRNQDGPFALLVQDKSPHQPHITPEEYDSYFTNDLPEPETFNHNFEDKNQYIREGKARWSKLKNAFAGDIINSRVDLEKNRAGNYEYPFEKGTQEFKEWAYQTLFKGYYRQVKNLDDNIGRLLDYLEESGLDENTIIVYTSDNGWFLGDYGLFNKMWMYEESLRIPFVISYSDHFSGNRVEDSIVSALDFGPTFLDYAGIEIPVNMQGRSLKPILEGDIPDDWRSSFYYHYYAQFDVPEQFGIRTDDYKLIQFVDSTKTEWELYDLQADPKELHNVIDDPNYEHLRDTLREELEQLQIRFEN